MARTKTARPSTFTPAIGDRICKWLVSGRSLIKFCQQPNGPKYDTVVRWILSNAQFGKDYSRARELQADRFINEVIDIADDSLGDYYLDKAGRLRVDGENAQRSRLKVETRIRCAALIAPKKYGAAAMEAGPVNVKFIVGQEAPEWVQARIEARAEADKKPTTGPETQAERAPPGATTH